MSRLDREAFAALYRDHVGRLTAFAVQRSSSPGEVADLVAATFLVAMEQADSYDPTRGDPAAWLFGIAANLAANQRRRAVRQRLATARLDARALLNPDDVDALLTRMEAVEGAAKARRALDTLPERQRRILIMAGEGSLDSAAAAAGLGISPAAYRVRLSRARRALRRAMETDSTDSATGDTHHPMTEALL